MAGHLDVPLDVVALHEFDTCHVVGPRRRFDGLPHDVLITTASQARMALGRFMRDSGTMTRLRILLANDTSCGIACNRLKNPAVIERLANLVERGVFGLAQIKPIRTAAIRGLHQQFVQTHPASAEAQRACASVMPIANRTAHPPATLASLHRSGAHTSSNSSQQVATPASPAPITKAFSEWSLEDRFAEALKRTAPKLPSQFKNAFAEILTPEVAATVVGTLVLIAGAHAIGGLAAAAFDALLIGVAFVFLGWTAFEAGQQLGKFFYLTMTATDAAALDYAAEALAKVVVLIGVEALLVWLTKAATKSVTSRRGTTTEAAKPLAPNSQPPTRTISSAENKPVQINATRPDAPQARAPSAILVDVGTKPGTAFFWSGRTRGIGGSEKAAKIAAERGGTTLETLINERRIAMPDWNTANPESVKQWKDVSRQYANGVSGEVRAVVGQDLRPGNVWQNEELPALLKNPRVTKIIIIDPFSGVERVIYP